MVFCRECNKKVDDCEHFVPPLGVPAIPVFDPKIKTLAYKNDAQVLEIAFKNGQVWQLAGLQNDIYDALLLQTLSSFLKFVAHRYNASPVRTENESCPACNRPMAVEYRTTGTGAVLRILLHCGPC